MDCLWCVNWLACQYFYLGESVLYDIPAAANFVVGTFYIVEMAEDGNEGLVYGLITTVANLGVCVYIVVHYPVVLCWFV